MRLLRHLHHWHEPRHRDIPPFHVQQLRPGALGEVVHGESVDRAPERMGIDEVKGSKEVSYLALIDCLLLRWSFRSSVGQIVSDWFQESRISKGQGVVRHVYVQAIQSPTEKEWVKQKLWKSTRLSTFVDLWPLSEQPPFAHCWSIVLARFHWMMES